MPVSDEAQVTTTVSLPKGYTKIPLDGDDGMDSSTSVWLKFDGQRFDVEPTTCTRDADGTISVTGPGIEQVSGKDAYLKIDIKKDGNFSTGTITFNLGAKTIDGDGTMLTGKIGGGEAYTLSSYDATTTEINAAMKNEDETTSRKGEFFVDCG